MRNPIWQRRHIELKAGNWRWPTDTEDGGNEGANEGGNKGGDEGGDDGAIGGVKGGDDGDNTGDDVSNVCGVGARGEGDTPNIYPLIAGVEVYR